MADPLDRLLPGSLRRLRSVTGLPVAFAGVVPSDGARLLLTRLAGTRGRELAGLTVPAGRGLGGRVLAQAAPQRVADYGSTPTITHEFDRVVVDAERLASVAAVPVLAGGRVRAVLYAADREARPVGDRALRSMAAVADQLAEDLAGPVAVPDPATAALADLARLVEETGDPALRARLAAIHGGLTAPARPGPAVVLAPREVQVLALVEVGAGNAEIAGRLGLAPETVKAYLRSAMRRLDVGNRTAAAHVARRAGLLPPPR